MGRTPIIDYFKHAVAFVHILNRSRNKGISGLINLISAVSWSDPGHAVVPPPLGGYGPNRRGHDSTILGNK